MRRLLVFSASLVLLSLAVGACLIVGERGSGTMAAESRDVSGFDEIDLSGSGRVLVAVTGTESLTVEAEDNILPLLTTEVRNGTLELGARQSISPTREIVYTITVVSLEGVTVSGSGSVTATNIDADAFSVDIGGSGTVVSEGASESLNLSISGSGGFEGEGLVSATGTVEVSGSGDAVVNVSRSGRSAAGWVGPVNDPDSAVGFGVPSTGARC